MTGKQRAMAGNSGKSFDEKLEALLTGERVWRFQLWQPLLAAIALVVGVVMFSSFAIKGGEKGANIIERSANAIANIPLLAHKIVYDIIHRENAQLAQGQRFKDKIGMSLTPGAGPAGTALALARYEGDSERGIVEIRSLDDGSVIHVYRPDANEINALSKLPKDVINLKRDFNPKRYLPYSPVPEADGSLVFHAMGSPLVKLDACSHPVWSVDGNFHHSIERDADGNYWVPELLAKPVIPYVGDDFSDDAITEISPNGEVLFRKSVDEILIESGLARVIYSHDQYLPDGTHLNDIQPAFADGPYWKKGDLFLNLRNPAMIALYRPSENKLLWTKEGPWLLQHDVDIISDHEIGVFNNNSAAGPDGFIVRGSNNMLVYDFATGKVSSPFQKGFEENGVRTKSNGLFTLLPDGSLMVEEQNYGRLLAFDRTGREKWSFVNRAPKDGRVFQLGWSRFIGAGDTAKLKAAYAAHACPAAGQ